MHKVRSDILISCYLSINLKNLNYSEFNQLLLYILTVYLNTSNSCEITFPFIFMVHVQVHTPCRKADHTLSAAGPGLPPVCDKSWTSFAFLWSKFCQFPREEPKNNNKIKKRKEIRLSLQKPLNFCSFTIIIH